MSKLIKSGVSIGLVNPKYPHNVGAAIRGASCFGAENVFFSGNRIPVDNPAYRIPREERMKGYQDVHWEKCDKFFDRFDSNVIPVAIEFRPGSESLDEFEHPENALYVFGPEDGSLGRGVLTKCHRFIVIPTRHCLNLSVAVNIVLYDRISKLRSQGIKETYSYGPKEDMLEDIYQQQLGREEELHKAGIK